MINRYRFGNDGDADDNKLKNERGRKIRLLCKFKSFIQISHINHLHRKKIILSWIVINKCVMWFYLSTLNEDRSFRNSVDGRICWLERLGTDQSKCLKISLSQHLGFKVLEKEGEREAVGPIFEKTLLTAPRYYNRFVISDKLSCYVLN